MRRLLVASIAALSSISLVQIASAADMPRKAPVAAPALYNWTGLYIGANVGGGWGSRSFDYTSNDPATAFFFGNIANSAPPAVSFKSSGLIGGLQLGYNWQLNRQWLVGLETDFDFSSIKGSGSSAALISPVVPISTSVDERIKWFGTVRARLGYLPTDNLLTYITGGFAYGRVAHSGNYANNSASIFFFNTGGFASTCQPFTTCFAGSSSSVATGWTAGAGFEYAVAHKWTLKAEYLYVSLGSKSFTETAVAPNPSFAVPSFNENYSRTSFNVARLGLNYRF